MVVAVIFGLAGGIVGQLIARVYIIENAISLPLLRDISLAPGDITGPSLIIRDAKMVVVEQDNKIRETAAAVAGGIVGIYERITPATGTPPAVGTSALVNTAGYKKGDELGQGFIITSDGWIVSGFKPPFSGTGTSSAGSAILPANKYAVITKDGKVYPADAVLTDPWTGYAFWRIKATALPVKKFAPDSEIGPGQSVIAVNRSGWMWPSFIMAKTEEGAGQARSSDRLEQTLLLTEAHEQAFTGAFLFNLNGDLLGLINKSGGIDSIVNILPAINSLLKNKEVVYPGLGVNYLDLSEMVALDPKEPARGALLVKNGAAAAVKPGGAADKAGLREGDIITAINGLEINENNSLNGLIAGQVPGDKITVTYLRQGARAETPAVLEGLK